MKIGCVKEIKNNEFRVGLTPDNVKAYVSAGHHVYIEKGAGIGSGFADTEYVEAGASVLDNAPDIWNMVDMMIKVKEPLESEYKLFHDGLILYTYLHLAADKEQMDALLEGKVKAVAYETLQETDRSLPLLAPMSQIAGRLSIQEGAKYLEKKFGGAGILLAGVPGTPKANVVILGGGTVGMNACKIAVGMGANVTILDVNLKRLEQLDNMFGAHMIGGTVQRILKIDGAILIICCNIERAVMVSVFELEEHIYLPFDLTEYAGSVRICRSLRISLRYIGSDPEEYLRKKVICEKEILNGCCSR